MEEPVLLACVTQRLRVSRTKLCPLPMKVNLGPDVADRAHIAVVALRSLPRTPATAHQSDRGEGARRNEALLRH